MKPNALSIAGIVSAFLALWLMSGQIASAQTTKPNILVIWGDDVGWSNISAYNLGMMGYRTPNIDRIAGEGMLFTDYYAQQSCTAGRSAFITGQHPFRTGLLTVGLPGSPIGLQAEDPTIADLLKEQGYMTGHFGPRGAMDCKASDRDDTTEEPRWDRVGKQSCQDTGPVTRKRMETMENEILERSLAFIDKAHEADKPFFIWHNMLRMHVWTRLSDQWKGKTGLGIYADGMQETDWVVGKLLKKLDDLGIADNTIVVLSSDNGAEKLSWPDGGTSPFHGEKGETWEGGFRAPAVVRWPGVVEPGSISHGIFSHEDWLPTLLAAAGDSDIVEKLKSGHQANGRSFRVHIDGYNQMDLLSGTGPSNRQEILYFDDRGSLNAVRINDWKVHFAIGDRWFGGDYGGSAELPSGDQFAHGPFREYHCQYGSSADVFSLGC